MSMDNDRSDEDVSHIISLIYETVLAPNFSGGFTEKDGPAVDTSHLSAYPTNQVLDRASIEQALPHLNHALAVAAKTNPPKRTFSPQ
ncbi:MAG: hypothetical protein KUG53_02960, partial [Pseudomonadales bacterium]|nr:hypothetical protein [Pseudomonadales bacterium]